jgi:hypothetical protein
VLLLFGLCSKRVNFYFQNWDIIFHFICLRNKYNDAVSNIVTDLRLVIITLFVT